MQFFLPEVPFLDIYQKGQGRLVVSGGYFEGL
jgi:hypothetical protein